MDLDQRIERDHLGRRHPRTTDGEAALGVAVVHPRLDGDPHKVRLAVGVADPPLLERRGERPDPSVQAVRIGPGEHLEQQTPAAPVLRADRLAASTLPSSHVGRPG